MEKERLKFCIERYDHYFDSINNKNAVYIALGTFLVGGLLTCYSYFLKNVNMSTEIEYLYGISVSLGALALIIVTISSIPYLSKADSSKLNFNSIASVEKDLFFSESGNLKKEDELSDLRSQVYLLAVGLKRKFNRLKIAGILYVSMFITLIPLIILIIKNFKE